MDNGFTDPTKAINILQKYQLNCKTACDRLNAHLNMSDYPKFKKIIESIASISEEFVSISQGEIDQYSDLRLWSHRETALKMLQNEDPFTLILKHLRSNSLLLLFVIFYTPFQLFLQFFFTTF